MEIGILITDGGPHPADKWAALTAKTICDLLQVDENSVTPLAVAARKAKPRLQLDLADALEAVYLANQEDEQARVKKNIDNGALPAIDPTDGPHLDAAMAALINAAKPTPFAGHFGVPEVTTAVRNILAQHLGDISHIEHSWHADRNPQSKFAKAFRRRYGVAAAA